QKTISEFVKGSISLDCYNFLINRLASLGFLIILILIFLPSYFKALQNRSISFSFFPPEALGFIIINVVGFVFNNPFKIKIPPHFF
ncbi:MAG TPA: hypothetical protein VHJ38_13405, partial [Nitrososphaeraceae archaeon]|nr:hypothetical protein [Nitrososphaeraceae archaeon]